MKTIWTWLVSTCIVFGVFGGTYHIYLTQYPRRILVVVDSSFPMRSVWPRVPGILEDLGGRRYATFALITEKKRIHGWSSKFELGSVSPLGPRNLDKLLNKPHYMTINEGTEVHLITNAAQSVATEFDDWVIHRLR